MVEVEGMDHKGLQLEQLRMLCDQLDEQMYNKCGKYVLSAKMLSLEILLLGKMEDERSEAA